MKCEQCGREIDYLEVDMFNEDGSDDWYLAEVIESGDVVCMNVLPQWTGAELSEEEQVETIRCPHCKQFPFARKFCDSWKTVSMILYPTERKEE